MGSSLCLVATLEFGYAAQPEGCMGGRFGGVSFRRGRIIIVQITVLLLGKLYPVVQLFSHVGRLDMAAVVFLDHTGAKISDRTGTVREKAQALACQFGIVMQLAGQRERQGSRMGVPMRAVGAHRLVEQEVRKCCAGVLSQRCELWSGHVCKRLVVEEPPDVLDVLMTS